MVNNSDNKNSQPTCFQCGSALIFVSQEIVKPDGMRYPQTNTIYRCSNVECQEKMDKAKEERRKIRETRMATEKARMEKMDEKRRLGRKAKAEEN